MEFKRINQEQKGGVQMNKTAKVLTVAGVGVGVGVATAAFLKTEKGQEVKEIVKEKITTIVNEVDAFIKESQEAISEGDIRPVVKAKFFDINENEEVYLMQDVEVTIKEDDTVESN